MGYGVLGYFRMRNILETIENVMRSASNDEIMIFEHIMTKMVNSSYY